MVQWFVPWTPWISESAGPLLRARGCVEVGARGVAVGKLEAKGGGHQTPGQLEPWLWVAVASKRGPMAFGSQA